MLPLEATGRRGGGGGPQGGAAADAGRKCARARWSASSCWPRPSRRCRAARRWIMQALVQEVPVVSDQAEALDVLEILQKSEHHFALVYDEYGHFEGIITTDDVLEAITGAVASAEPDEPAMVEREDGSFLVAGWMPVDEFCDRLGLPRELAGEYDTVAGLVLHQLGQIPDLGDRVHRRGLPLRGDRP